MAAKQAPKRAPKRDKLEDFLGEIPRETLSAWLLASAKESPDLKRRLELFAAQHSNPQEAILSYRALLKGAGKCRNRNPRKRAREISQNFLQLHAALQADFEQGKLDVAVEILPEALVAMDSVRDKNTDPSQQLAEIQSKLEALFFQAASELRPRPERLAERIHDAQSCTFHNVLVDAAYQFRDVLGDLGLAHYRALLEPEWQRHLELHAQKAGGGKPRYFDPSLDMLREQLLSWARAIEPRLQSLKEQAAVLEVLGDSAEDYTQGVALYQRAGETGKALQLAADGFEALIGRKTPLSGFPEIAALYIELLQVAARPADALATAWRAYQALPGRASYLQLLSVAYPEHAKATWRQKAEALALARSHDLFLEILLAEDRVEEARSFAAQSGLSSVGWAALAKHLAKKSPQEAIPILAQIASREADNNTWGNYDTVLDLFRQAHALARTPALEAIFTANLEEFRIRNKSKTSIVRRLIF